MNTIKLPSFDGPSDTYIRGQGGVGAASRHRRVNSANAALGVAAGALVGLLTSLFVLPQAPVALCPAALGASAGALGLYATRIGGMLKAGLCSARRMTLRRA
jgi:hypothetical protein